MSTAFIGEVRLVGFNFAPVDWSFCNGALVGIAQNSTLFNLIGTTYGGDGQATFGLPDLRGRIPVHQGSNGTNTYVTGQVGGVENVIIGMNQYPSHTHLLLASTDVGNSNAPAGNTVGAGLNAYSANAPTNAMSSAMIGISNGGNLPHSNQQPFLVLNWIISLFGIYPSQG